MSTAAMLAHCEAKPEIPQSTITRKQSPITQLPTLFSPINNHPSKSPFNNHILLLMAVIPIPTAAGRKGKLTEGMLSTLMPMPSASCTLSTAVP